MPIQQSIPAGLLSLRKTREHAAFWRRACPDLSTVPRRLYHRVSRWRNGTAPSVTEDLDELIAALGPDAAALIVERVLASYELYHGAADGRDLYALWDAEQHAESLETAVQLRAARDPAALARWIEEAEAELAVQRRAIAAARARLYGLDRAA